MSWRCICGKVCITKEEYREHRRKDHDVYYSFDRTDKKLLEEKRE